MLDRAVGSLVTAATACAAAVVAVFAAGFALYSVLVDVVGPAPAAGIVSLAAALLAGSYPLYLGLRARERARASQAAQADLIAQVQAGVGQIAQRHPTVTLLVTVITGAIAARHPQLARDLLAAVARLTPQADEARD